uniref:uncharacterized protein LOC113475667 n=1 Tax=Ciona intestinalis TaxID=7719 RepID=UPI000EF551A5|nr:uncharacterized protein LOC113475667 [Ciona intestinalis]|eukprot:XP_026695921.1 uncharacterized protein LOC113475667 [Ciona intestinalis]
MELLDSESGDINEWQQMFFREQIVNSNKKSPYSRRYHPDVVRWAIELCSRSPSAYQHLVTTDVLKLPSSRTLQKFRQHEMACTHPSLGVQNISVNLEGTYCGHTYEICMNWSPNRFFTKHVFPLHICNLIHFQR